MSMAKVYNLAGNAITRRSFQSQSVYKGAQSQERKLCQTFPEVPGEVRFQGNFLHCGLNRKSDFLMEKERFFFSRITTAQTTLTAWAKTVASAAPAASR